MIIIINDFLGMLSTLLDLVLGVSICLERLARQKFLPKLFWTDCSLQDKGKCMVEFCVWKDCFVFIYLIIIFILKLF